MISLICCSPCQIAIPQNAPDYVTVTPVSRRRLLGAGSLAGRVAGLFADPQLRAAALYAAECEWEILPPGSAAALLSAPVDCSRPRSSFLLAAVKYAVFGAYNDWVEEGSVAAPAQAGVTPAAQPGTITDYLYGDGLADSGTGEPTCLP